MSTQYDQKTEFLDYLFNGSPHNQITSWFAGILTDLPDGTAGNQGTEVVGNNYARMPISFNPASDWINNNGEVEFPAAIPLGWGIVVGVGLYDADVGGDLKFFVPCQSLDVLPNMILRILDGELILIGV